MLEDVTKRLLDFGYTITDNDTWVLGFIIQKIENHIKNQCNVSAIPDGLHQTAVDMVCGEFLLEKKNIGQLTIVNLDAAVKSIQEGDTNITFAVGAGSMTSEQRLDALISYLMHPDADYASYRCVKW